MYPMIIGVRLLPVVLIQTADSDWDVKVATFLGPSLA